MRGLLRLAQLPPKAAEALSAGKITQSVAELIASRPSEAMRKDVARYALETASRGYVLQTGAIIASGLCAVLKQDERVKQAYLGRR